MTVAAAFDRTSLFTII